VFATRASGPDYPDLSALARYRCAVAEGASRRFERNSRTPDDFTQELASDIAEEDLGDISGGMIQRPVVKTDPYPR